MKILNFDYVYSLNHIVSVGETATTYKLESFPGGKGINQSIAVAKAVKKYIMQGVLAAMAIC